MSKRLDSEKKGQKEQDAQSIQPEVSFLSSQVLIPTTILCSTFGLGFYVYRSYLRRIPNSHKIPQSFFRKRSLYGFVTSVGDADNFHFYHTPGGIIGGWGWLRHAPKVNSRGLKGQTIHVRLCGVDAPEAAHFGKPAQPYSAEALDWLRGYVLGRHVRVMPLVNDQYGRTVGQASLWKWNGRRNVSKEMLRQGWAVVYEAKQGAEFNGQEAAFRKLEQASKNRKIGMFRKGTKSLVTPGEYKKKYSNS
ncbi:Lcl3p [Sugiyamaella lignohabitans]|uniref:Probable endonuclease LCL3 n=1 Tax=Sugiyamaella lignohabitans TaxID=796027 RepID=A0A167DQP5_9ASCO|nr:Lcl3p [Sugiyamaella lignohabitans]ANB13178.1 Lcl3p [Sugiyamaella lignohabitans]